MMMMMIFRVLLIVWGTVFLVGCQSLTAMTLDAQSPEVLVADITPLDATLFEQRLQVDLRVRNPNNFDLEINGLDFTLYLNDKRLARGLSNKASTVPRLGDALLSVETTTSTLDVVRQLLQFQQDQDLTYQIEGVLHLQDSRVPFENKGVILEAEEIFGSSPAR